jgi:geranylgeranyl diphosphate synthase type II
VFELERYLKARAREIDAALERAIDPHRGADAKLFEAMRYSLLAGGKRLRPILVLASCESVGGAGDRAMGLACAVEMIHTYSLIHDDLPCMDNDDFRRGRPTNHKVYGDAIATLAGDALLTDAFKILADSARGLVAPDVVLETVAELAHAAGSGGMVAGQVIDLEGEGKSKTIEELEELHAKKTGALFLASILGGARLGGASKPQLIAFETFGRALGLSFQVVDDLLDVEGDAAALGKAVNKDQAHGKQTYPSILGVEESHALARKLESRAIHALDSFDERAEPLRAIARFVVERKT